MSAEQLDGLSGLYGDVQTAIIEGHDVSINVWAASEPRVMDMNIFRDGKAKNFFAMRPRDQTIEEARTWLAQMTDYPS